MISLPTSLHEKAAQLVFPRLGSRMPPPVTVSEDADRVEALLDRYPFGGLLLFHGHRGRTPAVLARLQARNRIPLLIGADVERGVGQQVQGATLFPHAMAFAAADDAGEAVEALARATAREALSCGIHLAFAPVADVHRHPENPIIATRAFGTEPERVAHLVRAYLRGARAEGLLTTAKHFPGHGGTRTDSHAELPVVEDDRDVLERTDLVPFRAALRAGVDGIMTAHVAYPALDPIGQPATRSPSIVTGLLRGELGFDGLVVTDSLRMAGIQHNEAEPPGAQAAALLQAGVDVLLDPPDPAAVADGLVEAVEQGRLDGARLDAACRRVVALKRRLYDRFGEQVFADPAACVPLTDAEREGHRALADRVAREAVTVQDGGSGRLPLDPQAETLVLVMDPRGSGSDDAVAPLAGAARAAFAEATVLDVQAEGPFELLLHRATGAAQVVVVLVVTPAAWHAYGLHPAHRRVLEALAGRRELVLAALGSPHVLEAFPQATRICTFSDVPSSQRALVERLAGS